MDINLIYLTPHSEQPRRNLVHFALCRTPNKAINMEALLQLCAKTVLTVQGRDRYDPYYGGGLLAYKNKNISAHEVPRVYADIAYIIQTSEEQILAKQAILTVGVQERLKALTLLNVEYLPATSGLDISVLVESQAGESAEISLANQLKVGNY